jgi:hypothetical protein
MRSFDNHLGTKNFDNLHAKTDLNEFDWNYWQNYLRSGENCQSLGYVAEYCPLPLLVFLKNLWDTP